MEMFQAYRIHALASAASESIVGAIFTKRPAQSWRTLFDTSLDNAMYKYVSAFANNEIKGRRLLDIRPYELVELGMHLIGHQEIILGAVEQLRRFNYDFEKENLQHLALRVATTAKNLHHQLAHHTDKSKIETQILNDITRAIATIKPLVGWLDRSPFQGQLQFNEIRKQISRLGVEMAMSAQRDRFVENPVDHIRLTAEKLSKLADYVIQDISDPIILQPATLNLVTIKKRESDLGFNIRPNYHGIHVITDIKCNSTAHISGKIEDGDEIIQINYQTVIGWHYERVLLQLQESPPDVLLTLKKRPRHTKIYGQIYMKPYRLPSKKRAMPYRFGENLPSPRVELASTQNFPAITMGERSTLCDSDSSSSSSILGPPESAKNDKDMRLFLQKPRAALQRRNTICGDQASGYSGNIMFWHEINVRPSVASGNLRDKSVSFGFGLENAARPSTCIGMHNAKSAHDKYGDKGAVMKGSLPDIKAVDDNACKLPMITTPPPPTAATIKRDSDQYAGSVSAMVHSSAERARHPDAAKSKAVKFNTSHNDIGERVTDNSAPLTPHAATAAAAAANNRNGAEEVAMTQADNHRLSSAHNESPQLPLRPRPSTAGNGDISLAEAVNTTLINNQNEITTDAQALRPDDDKPPEINPRKEFLTKIAPKPPPRPSKAAEIVQRKFDALRQERSGDTSPNLDHHGTDMSRLMPPMYPMKPADATLSDQKSASSPLLQRLLTPKIDDDAKSQLQTPPKPAATVPRHTDEEYELLTPNKTKTLTLKKKNSLLAKRRKISLKTLEISDIQGHLFRRIRDKHGASYWEKLYFVLVETALYGFRSKKSTKANCMIFLPGFTISLAKEVHSKQFAYKVYHPKKTFYFAAESEQALAQWMDYIKRATLKGPSAIDPTQIDSINPRDLFSETESSDDESNVINEAVPQTLSFKQSFLGGYKSAKKRGSVDEPASAAPPKSEKYHLGFGSLKKFAPFSSSKSSEKEREEKERKKAQSDVPVPTSRFRSYRKIPGNAGMQVGSSTMQNDFNLMAQMASQNQQQPPPPPPAVKPAIQPEQRLPKQSDILNAGAAAAYASNASCNTIASHSPLLPPPTSSLNARALDSSGESSPSSTLQSPPYEYHMGAKTPAKLAKNKTLPFNYLHASNPNLVEFTFQTSKTLDVGLPKVNSSNAFDPHQNAQGLMTLMDLMLQCEEDEAHNMYNNRVNLGVEKPGDVAQNKRKPRPSNDSTTAHDESENTPHNGQKNKIQSRSLPKTPDYAQSFKTDDSEIIMARTKEGQKLRDFGYEFITGDDMNSTANASHGNGGHGGAAAAGPNSVQTSAGSATTKSNIASRLQPAFLLPSKRKGLNWISLNLDKRNDEEKLMNKGSFKLLKPKPHEPPEPAARSGKGENHRPILNRFVASKSDGAASEPHSSPYQANQTAPVQPSDSQSALSGYGERKHSSASSNAASYLSKLSFSASKTPKEKRLLGSPRLHRAASSLFGRRTADNANAVDHEMFMPLGPGHSASASMSQSSESMSFAAHSQVMNDGHMAAGSAHAQHFTPLPAAPMVPITEQNVEYPAAPEPESYSSCDANASLRLIRRRTFNHHNSAGASTNSSSSNNNNNIINSSRAGRATHLPNHSINNDSNNNSNNGTNSGHSSKYDDNDDEQIL